MITSREYFAYIFGALTTIDKYSGKDKSRLLQKMGEDSGLSKEEMKEIITDFEKHLIWSLSEKLSQQKDEDFV